MKSLQKSKILKDKPYLWDLTINIREQMRSEMEVIYGSENIGTKARRLIEQKLSVQDLNINDKTAIGQFLINSFMAINGGRVQQPKFSLGDRLNRIEERLSQIEARLGIVPE